MTPDVQFFLMGVAALACVVMAFWPVKCTSCGSHNTVLDSHVKALRCLDCGNLWEEE